jgi:4-amino-4-deoxy-L-arabinose transferase-like glycosyltransferase
LLLALSIRLAWGLSRPSDAAAIEQLPDQREYLQLADHLLHGEGLHFFDPRFGQEIYASRTPGYPLFLATCGGKPAIARVAQAFIDTATVLAAFLLARRWMNSRQSAATALLIAVNPFLVYFSGLILSETLYTALLVWGMVLLVGSTSRLRLPLLGGIVLALSVLVRPSGIGLPILLAIAAAILNRKEATAYPRWWPFPPATTMLLFTLAVLAPWAYRNDKVLGHWIWTTTNSGITAYDGFNDDATGASDQRFTLLIPGISRAGEVERNEFFADEASRWVKHHPGRAVELACAKIARMWSPVPLSAEYGKPLYRWIGGIYALPLDLLILLGLFWGPLPRAAKVYLLLPAIYLTAIHAMSVGSLRYRLPAEPMMSVVACSFAFVTRSQYRRAGTQDEPLIDAR